MLPKKNRVDKKLVEEIFKKGSFVGSSFLSLKYFLNKDNNYIRASFVVPKKVEKGAVGRNYLRRRGYLVLEKYFKKLPNGFSGVFVFNKRPGTTIEIENDIKNVLSKIENESR